MFINIRGWNSPMGQLLGLKEKHFLQFLINPPLPRGFFRCKGIRASPSSPEQDKELERKYPPLPPHTLHYGLGLDKIPAPHQSAQ